jgi:hypothetical protein
VDGRLRGHDVGWNVEGGARVLGVFRRAGCLPPTGHLIHRQICPTSDDGIHTGGAAKAILVDMSTKVICQGITGSQGTFHAKQAKAYARRSSRNAGQGRHHAFRSRACGRAAVRQRAGSQEGDRLHRHFDLRAAAVRGGRHPRG